MAKQRGGGVNTSAPAPTLHLNSISAGDTTLSISADEPITRAVADDAALLAGITVHYTPFEGTRSTDNIATAATITNNAIIITISHTAAGGDEFFVQLAAGLVQNTAGMANIALSGDEALTYKVAISPFIVMNLPRSTRDRMSDNYRSYHITFSIRTGTAEAGEYTLGLKPAASSAPSVAELRSATAVISRALSNTVINLYLPFHMEGTYFNAGVTQNFDTALATLLSPATTYTLYATKKDGTGPILAVSDFTTDALPTTAPGWYGSPSNSYTYTISDEVQPFLFIVVFATPVEILFVQLGKRATTDLFVRCRDPLTCRVNPELNENGFSNGFTSSDRKTFIISTDEDTITRAEQAFKPDDGSSPTPIPISFTIQASP